MRSGALQTSGCVLLKIIYLHRYFATPNIAEVCAPTKLASRVKYGHEVHVATTDGRPSRAPEAGGRARRAASTFTGQQSAMPIT